MDVHFRTLVLSLPLLVVSALGCTPPQRAFPVFGETNSIERLAGRWVGDYYNPSTGRTGTIVFNFLADSDSGYGSVVMVASGSSMPFRPYYGEQSSAAEFRKTQTLKISFVVVDHDYLKGSLAPYQDPDCECLRYTIFEGQRSGDTVEGLFRSHGNDGQVVPGKWKVMRDKPNS